MSTREQRKAVFYDTQDWIQSDAELFAAVVSMGTVLSDIRLAFSETGVSMGTVLSDIRLAFSETGTCDIENRPQWLPELVTLRTVPNGCLSETGTCDIENRPQ